MVVTELPSRRILGLNQRTYQRLKLSLTLNLRRQILIAVCDDLILRDRLAAQLPSDFSQETPPIEAEDTPETQSDQPASQRISYEPSIGTAPPGVSPQIMSLRLEINAPDLQQQVLATVLRSRRIVAESGMQTPTVDGWCLQIVGIEHLTRQSGTRQRQFLNSLRSIETLINQLDCSLLIWLPWPWFRSIQQAAPEFWHSRTGVFEFAGEPTPMETTTFPNNQWLLSTDPLPSALTAMQPAPTPPPIQAISSRSDHAQIQPQQTAEPALEQPEGTPHSQEHQANVTSSRQSEQLRLSKNLPIPLPLVGPDYADEHPNPTVYPAQSPGGSTVVQNEPTPVLPTPVLTEAETQTTAANTTEHALALTHPSEPLPHHLWLDLCRHAPRQTPLEINLLQRIERLTQQQADGVMLANTYWTLGQHYRDRLAAGDTHRALVNAAIVAYEGAHQGLPATTPGQSELLNDLGSLYWLQAQHIESPPQALAMLEKALETYQQGTHHTADPDTLSRLHSNLAAIYTVLANHNQPEHYLKQAIAAYHKSLHHMQPEIAPLEYASLQNSLGAIYWRLAQQPERAHAYLKHAITAYIEARRHCQPHQDPVCYAMIQNNLGIAYWSLSQFQQPGLMLKQAIAAYHSALAYRTLALDPAGCATTQNNLGTAYWELAKQQSESTHRQRKLQRRAITAYQSALNAVQRLQTQQGGTSHLSFAPKTTHHSLAILYRQLAENQDLPEKPRSQHLSKALKHALAAIATVSANTPNEHSSVLTTLVQTIRAHYQLLGLAGQQAALTQVPSNLLPGLLAQL